MTKFNSKLRKLLKTEQQQQKYTEYKNASKEDKKNMSLWQDIDVDNNGRISNSDKITIKSEKNKILKKEMLFVVFNDGEFNQSDVDLFLNGDVNGDGKITQKELNFVSKYKNNLKEAMVKQKADFTLDGKKYVDGELASGTICGKYYKDGVLFTGENGGKTYVYGNLLANGETYVLNNDKVAVVTSKVLAKASDCEIRTEKTYDEDGKLISDNIRVSHSSGDIAYILPATENLDLSKITKVSSNEDGSFTVIADGKNYNFNDFSFKTYDKTTGTHTGDVTRKDGKTISHTTYNNGYTVTYTDYVNGKWTKAESVYNDGYKVKYSRSFNEDGSYTRVENKYNAEGEIVEMRTSAYDNSERMIKSEEYVEGKYNKDTGKYEGGTYSERTREYKGNSKNYYKCTRTSYTDDTKTVKKEYKEYNFLDESQTKANVSLTIYNDDGSINNVIKQTCYFGLKDENGLEYRYYLRDDGCIEIWHYDIAGGRTKVTVTQPDGKQVTHNYNASGQFLGDTWSEVSIDEIKEKYGKDENGNYLKYINN